MTACTCPRIDGYVLIRQSCPHHPEAAARRAEKAAGVRDAEATDAACAWADYRKDYGVSAGDMTAAHKAFLAGWQAARQGDQSGVQR